jgi:peptidoglycan/LPS O-acetylase OafA/YrhL
MHERGCELMRSLNLWRGLAGGLFVVFVGAATLIASSSPPSQVAATVAIGLGAVLLVITGAALINRRSGPPNSG